MAQIWIDDHGSGIGQQAQRMSSSEAGLQMMAAWDAFRARGYRLLDSTAGHVVLRCSRHAEGACAQINVQR
jgi:hypothetical protein